MATVMGVGVLRRGPGGASDPRQLWPHLQEPLKNYRMLTIEHDLAQAILQLCETEHEIENFEPRLKREWGCRGKGQEVPRIQGNSG